MPSLAILTQLSVWNCLDGAPFGSYAPGSVSAGFSPYAPQLRLNAPVVASNTAMRWLPNPSATYSSLAAESTVSAPGRLNPVVLSLPSVLPALPICRTNLPVLSNFSTCASAGAAPAAGAAPRPRPAAAASPGAAGAATPAAGAAPPRAAAPAAGAAAPRPRPAGSDDVGSPLPTQTLPLSSTAIPAGSCGQS